MIPSLPWIMIRRGRAASKGMILRLLKTNLQFLHGGVSKDIRVSEGLTGIRLGTWKRGLPIQG